MNNTTDKLDKLVLDSFAVISVLHNEVSSKIVLSYLEKSRQNKLQLYLNEINLGEIFYTSWRVYGSSAAQDSLSKIPYWNINLISVDREFILAAASWKAQYKISYADAFCIETAHRHHCPILTGDPEFTPIKGIKIIKLPQD